MALKIKIKSFNSYPPKTLFWRDGHMFKRVIMKKFLPISKRTPGRGLYLRGILNFSGHGKSARK